MHAGRRHALDLPPAILLLGPIFVPLAATIGLDPVQLGLIMVLNLGIGLYTPPIGTTLFISSLDRTRLARRDDPRDRAAFYVGGLMVVGPCSASSRRLSAAS